MRFWIQAGLFFMLGLGCTSSSEKMAKNGTQDTSPQERSIYRNEPLDTWTGIEEIGSSPPALPFPGEPGPAPETEPQRITVDEGTNMAAAVSPDGESIAFTLQGTLWLIDSKGGKATALTDSMGDCQIPTWSPDGTWVAFQSYRSGAYQIWRVRSDGSGLEQLTYGVFDHREPHWSPNGEEIAFSSDRAGSYDIWSIELKSGALKRHTSDIKDASWPCYAPDGETLAFLAEKQGVYLLSPSDDQPSLVYSGSDIAAPSWSPDGESLIFARIGTATTKQQRLNLSTGKAEYLQTDNIDIFPFRTTWIGEELIYTADGGIQRRALEASESTHLPFEAELELRRPAYETKSWGFENEEERPVRGIRAPMLSPDGNSVVFSALSDIWIKTMGEPAEQLTNDTFVDLDPAWAPNGEKIVFASDRGGTMNLWVLDILEGEATQLTDNNLALVYPSWSPDGTQIACFEVGRKNLWSNATLMLVDAQTGAVGKAHAPLFVPSRPSWSPDSRYLALATLKRYSTRYREGLSEIRILDTLTGEKSTYTPADDISMGPRGASGPAWSPKGDSIVYTQRGHLWAQKISADGTPLDAPYPITQSPGESPSWSENQEILYLSKGSMYLIDAEGQEKTVDVNLDWAPEIHKESYAIHAGRLWDGVSEGYLSDVDVLIEGQRIVSIEPHKNRSIPVIDASESTLIPGLFDMHVHQHAIVGRNLGRSWLAHGITSVRELGSEAYDALERKEAWASGSRPGPRLFFTGGMFDGARIYYGFANSVTTNQHRSWELEKATTLGYDLLKTYVRLPDSEQKELTIKAHEMGIPITSHELYPAAAYGVDSVEHLGATSRRGFSLKQSALRIAYGDVRTILSESGMNMTPTLGALGGMVLHISLQPEVLSTPAYLALVPEAHRENFENAYFREIITQTRRMMVERQQAFIRDLVNAGGRITAGTDVPFLPFGWSLHIELQLYVDGGLSPFEALRSATSWAAEAAGVGKDLGSLEAGKLADIVMISGDPLANVQDAWNVQAVIKGGKRFTIGALLED